MANLASVANDHMRSCKDLLSEWAAPARWGFVLLLGPEFLRKNIFNSSCEVKYCHIQVYYCHYQLYTTSSLTLLVILADCCPHHASEESRDMWKFGAQFKGRHPHLTRQKCGMSRKLICSKSCTWAKRVGCVTQWLTPRWIGSGHGHFKKDFHCMAVREEPILAGNL